MNDSGSELKNVSVGEPRKKESVYTYATLYLNKGLSVIPLKPRSKEPLIPWKEFQDRIPVEQEISKWFNGSENNIAIVCGSVSDNLIVIDFDSIDLYDKWYSVIDRDYHDIRDIVLNTWVVETGKGIHIYLRIDVDRDTFRKSFRTMPRLVDGVDIKGEGGYVVAPPSIHPNGKEYRFRIGPDIDIAKISRETFDRVVQSIKELREKKEKEAKKEERRSREVKLRALSDSDIIKIKELLKEGYREGYRQHIWLYLSGWMARARIDPISCIKSLLMLYNEAGDRDPLKTRLSAVVYTYKKAGIDIDSYAKEIEELTGVKPYGLDKEISEEEIKGRSGLQEVLEEALGDEKKALEIIFQLEEILGAASPFRDSIHALLDYERNLYAIANLGKHIVVKARREGGEFIYKNIVFIGAPTHVEVYISPIGDITKYRVVWEIPSRRYKIDIGPATVEEILYRLRMEGLVVSKRDAEDVLNAVIEGFVRKSRAEIRQEIDVPGFYIVDGRLIAVKYSVEEPSVEELRKALLFLNELVAVWYGKIREKFVMVLKRGISAPFDYARKQLGIKPPNPDLALQGARNTAKTTAGEIAFAYLWGFDPINDRVSLSVGEVNSEYRFGRVVSRSTFGIVINECNSMFLKPELVNLIKAKVDGLVVRGRYESGRYREYLALSPIIYTLNPTPRVDFVMLELVPKTVILLEFTSSEVYTAEEIRKFNEEVRPRLSELKAVGMWIASYVLKKGVEILKMNWLDFAEHVLREAYRVAGLELPEWINIRMEIKDYVETIEDKKLNIVTQLREYINKQYTMHIGRLMIEIPDGEKLRIEAIPPENTSLGHRVRALIKANLIPWAFEYNGKIYITTEIFNTIGRTQATNLRDLAEILGIPDRYYEKKSIRIGKKVESRSVIELTIDEFIDLLKLEPEEEKNRQ